jgi:poly-gamma-glutamate biosynthesis protein PgsC/CapC
MTALAPEGLGIGLVAILLFGELFGLTAGGLIVPGYLALQADSPVRFAATIAVGLGTYACMRLINRVTLLYGRRRFVLTILVGFVLGLVLEQLIGWNMEGRTEARSIAFVLPGLLGHTMESQGVLVTGAALVIVTVLTRLVLVAVFGASVPL